MAGQRILPVLSDFEEQKISVVSSIGACDIPTLDEIIKQYKDNCGTDPDEDLKKYGYANLKAYLESPAMYETVNIGFNTRKLKTVYTLKPNPLYNNILEVLARLDQQIETSRQFYGRHEFDKE